MSDPESNPSAPSGPLKELSGRIGKYNIIKPLGKGAMGIVYLAHDTILERDVALKVMVASIADDPELKQRFEREAKAVARMTHPNVVNVFDLGSHTDGSPFIAMELLKGMDLQKAVRTPPPMTLDRKVNIIVQVLAGLAHAHQAGIVHRDIKPANIFINQDGTVKIMDFGVARLTTASMTGTGNIVGTADYMSPEQVKGAKVDGRSDLFSVGCMLYELMAGRRPFHSDNLMAIFYKITHEEPNFDLIPEGADYDDLMPVLKKSLAKTLDERYQTAYEFAVDLREFLKGRSTSQSGVNALEGLLELEAPSGPVPEPITDAPAGATLITGDEAEAGATMNLDVPTAQGNATPTVKKPGTQARGTTPRGTVATRVLGNTVSGSAQTALDPARAKGGPARAVPGPAARMTPLPVAPPSQGHPVLYVVLGAMGVALLAAGGYIYIRQSPTPSSTMVATVDTTVPPVSAAPATTVPMTMPPTAAPPPTFEAKGKFMKAAKAAFNRGDYDEAIAQGRRALAEDVGDASAKTVIENALNGQKAELRFRGAENALNAGDFDKAVAEANAGRDLASWDPRAGQLLVRIQNAQRRAADEAANREEAAKKAQLAQQLNGFIGQGDSALASAKYDDAISAYDQALKLDGSNQRALSGKSSAVQARALAAASNNGDRGMRGDTRPAGRTFASGKTVAASLETRPGGSVPEGFENTPGVEVKKGSTAADLPGKISFDIDPDVPKPGERYTVKVYMVNEGNAPIQLKDMVVVFTINGKKVSAPVPPQVRDVAPQQKALVMSSTEAWKEDTTGWAMEVTIHTARGESYRNQVNWK
jgi:tRNA A-37 threonylcarbamoyl transferase component Bud32/tetratricopeptide (TPR) repeat protein